MDCRAFRDQFSDFTDGFLDEAAEVGMCRHMADCEACRRFDTAYRAGASALRRLPVVHTTRLFERRLQGRILEACERPEPSMAHASGMIAAVMVLSLVGVAGWELARRPAPQASAPAPAAHGRRPADSFTVRLADDSSVDYPGPLPMIPVSRDSFRTPSRPAPSFQISVDYMVP